MVDKNRNKLRYTCMQRRFECFHKRSNQIMKELKENNNWVIEEETKLSKYNSKSCNFKDYADFVKQKNISNEKSYPFYEQEIFRKLIWIKYKKTQQSEAKLTLKIRKTFSNKGENICLLYGNWSQKKQMRNYLPTPGVFRRKTLLKQSNMKNKFFILPILFLYHFNCDAQHRFVFKEYEVFFIKKNTWYWIKKEVSKTFFNCYY